MIKRVTLRELLEHLLRMHGTFILQNEHGSMELRGNDLYLHPFQEWLTIYHTIPSPESQSHLHLRWATVRSAQVQRHPGQTPYLAFYRAPEPSGEPLLVWYFPSFYDWSRGQVEIPANIAQYDAFLATFGVTLQFLTEAGD